MNQFFEYALAFLTAALWMIVGAEASSYVIRCFSAILDIGMGGKAFCLFFSVLLYVAVSWFIWDYLRK